MKGDFSRDSFDPLKHYSGVLQQQGRVELDADTNERQSILLHHLRTLAADLIGPHGGPASGGFQLVDTYLDDSQATRRFVKNFQIGKGHYYVSGLLCENDADVAFLPDSRLPTQPWLPWQMAPLETNANYLVYLDAWERHVSATQADDPAAPHAPKALREVALDGPDTSSRAQTVWQVKTQKLEAGVDATKTAAVQAAWDSFHAADLTNERPRGFLQVKSSQTLASDAGKPCVVSPSSGYRGLENQLYRVEIHRGGSLADKPTFVWSRENGCIEFPIATTDASTIQLAEGWRDARLGLTVGDIVEVCVDISALKGEPSRLLRVTGVDLDDLTLTYKDSDLPYPAAPAWPAGEEPVSTRKLQTVLRRWDHGQQNANGDGRAHLADDLALRIEEGTWLTLEDGIAIQFAKGTQGNRYQTGDYWLIPARTALGTVLWPNIAAPGASPHGVTHRHAPLGAITVAASGEVSMACVLSRRFKPLADLA